MHMCQYITAVLPISAAYDELDALARRYGRQLLPLSNPSIEAQIGRDERYFLTTLGHCDCGAPLGGLIRGKAHTPDWSAQEQRFLKKGWSTAKAFRAIAQKQEDFQKSADASAETNLQAMSAWLDFIEAVLGSGKTSYLGLMLHMYSGSIQSHIDLAGREFVRSAELGVETLGRMKEDVLYVFQR